MIHRISSSVILLECWGGDLLDFFAIKTSLVNGDFLTFLAISAAISRGPACVHCYIILYIFSRHSELVDFLARLELDPLTPLPLASSLVSQPFSARHQMSHCQSRSCFPFTSFVEPPGTASLLQVARSCLNFYECRWGVCSN